MANNSIYLANYADRLVGIVVGLIVRTEHDMKRQDMKRQHKKLKYNIIKKLSQHLCSSMAEIYKI